jgi:hypothetical protein
LKKVIKIIWGKMLIEVVKEIDDLIRVIDCKISDDCCNSNTYFTNYENTERQCEDIIEIIMRNDRLRNLKQSILVSIRNLSKDSKYVILCKDFNKNLKKDFINQLDYTTKFYRMYESSLAELFDNFNKELSIMKFIKLYKNEPLIKRCLIKASKYHNKKNDVNDDNIFDVMEKEIG